MDFIRVDIPYSEVLNNAQIQQLAIASVLGGGKVVGTTDGMTTYSNISNNQNTYALLTYDVVAYIISLGGEVYNYQSYIVVDLTANVPSYIRDNSVTDLEGNETAITWEQWLANGQSGIVVDGKIYISGYAHYSGFKSSEKLQKHLTGTELTALRMNGFEVINKEDFKALLNEV